MTIIKAISTMDRAELEQHVATLLTIIRLQGDALTELGKLSDMQQARVGSLKKALAERGQDFQEEDVCR